MPAQSTGSSAAGCVTELEQIVCGVTNDVQEYWTEALPQFFNTAYQETETVWFTGGVSTGCGQASRETGPFYCPADNLVYIDLEFMQQLEEQLIGSTSDLAEQYILAHEYGHHVQNLLGTNAQVQQASAERPRAAPTSTRWRWSCRPTASPVRGSATRTHAACWTTQPRFRRRSLPPRASATIASSSKTQGPHRPRELDARLGRAAQVVVHDRLQQPGPDAVRHVRRDVICRLAAHSLNLR